MAVRVRLEDGNVLGGEVFAAVTGPDGLPERIVDRLNDSHESFLAFRIGDHALLVNKSRILTMSRAEEHRTEVEGLESGAGRQVPARIALSDGSELVGALFILMPPERSRVVDFLNDAPAFFPILGEDCVTLVSKSHVLSVRAEE